MTFWTKSTWTRANDIDNDRMNRFRFRKRQWCHVSFLLIAATLLHCWYKHKNYKNHTITSTLIFCFKSIALEKMTFFSNGTSSANDTVGYVVGYALLAACFFISMLVSIQKCIIDYRTERDLLLPWTCLVMIAENATYAALSSSREIPQAWAYISCILEATVAPSLLLSTFHGMYILQKTRHLHICGIRASLAPITRIRLARLVKHCFVLLALALLVLGLLVNFNIGFNPPSPVAGQVGWSYVIEELLTYQQGQVVLSLVPMTVVSACCFYAALRLWNYGTNLSMVVHHSIPLLNPWKLPFFGTVALFGGQWFGLRFYSILSNVGILLYVMTMLFLIHQIQMDVSEAEELNDFLQAFEDLRQDEEKHEQEYLKKDSSSVMEKVGHSELTKGDAVVIGDKVVKRNSKEDVEEVDEDKVKLEKGMIVEVVEEKTKIEEGGQGR